MNKVYNNENFLDVEEMNSLIMSGTVHTGGESLQDRLKVVQTCGTTLASAYILYHLSTA